jgi:uracil phosphoribosyltransferase
MQVIDVPMLVAADRGYIAIDSLQNRSMAGFIEQVVTSNNPAIYQLSIQQRDNFVHDNIKVGSLSGLLKELASGTLNQVIAFTHHPSAQLLATKSRRSDIIGPLLQGVHIEIGMFLADRLLDVLYRAGNILAHTRVWCHVQGTTFQGLCANDTKVMILPLMRGGEPMSRGFHQRFPLAQVVHWDDNCPPSKHELSGGAFTDLIIVDSVINSGKSIRHVLHHLHALATWSCPPRIYVVTGVIQSVASISLPLEFPRVRFLALRISDNKYSGVGGTDTGNRLFGTVF